VQRCIAPCDASRHSLSVFHSRSRKGAYICRGEPSTAQVLCRAGSMKPRR
jgi:hypothetical protein